MKTLTRNLTRDLAVGRALGEGEPIPKVAADFNVTEKRVYQLRAALLHTICMKAGRPELFYKLRPELAKRPILFLRMVEQYEREHVTQ